nr:uncharacterized protein LOC129381655 [Dermacentor andersoni]
MSAPAAVLTSQYPEEAESAGKGTPSRSPLLSATQRVRLQRRQWPAASPRALALLALSVAVACALAVVYYFYRSAPSGALQSQGALATRACVTAGCQEHASFFHRSLNTRVDPCVYLDAYVCSLWSPSSPMASDLAGQMTLTRALRATESLTRDATSEALDAGGELGAQHKVVSAFLRKCIAQKDDDRRSLLSVRDFAARLGIPWPYDANHPSVPDTHPFEVLIRLDGRWGLELWCQTTVLKRRRQKPIPPVLVVRRTDMASAWLGLVDALDNNQGRMAYYKDIHRYTTWLAHYRRASNAPRSLYGVPVPDAATADRHLKTEREVLTALATVTNETGREAVDTTVGRLESLFSHLGDIPLVQFLVSFFNASGIHERSRVYVESRRFVVALDELLGKFGKDRLMEHIAWWFAQLCAVMASSKARLLIGGNEEFIDILIAPTTKRIPEGGEAWRFYEGEGRLMNPYRGLLYRYLSNTLTVTQAATASPLFYADYSGGGVLRAASFGGLATAFLEAALRMFDRRGIRIDEGEARAWMSPRAERQLYRRFHCSSNIGENMLQVASLRVAWEAYKNASSGGDSSSVEALDILDSHGNAQRYTSDQLFFLTYCRRFCSTGTGCKSAVRSLPDFGSVFGCAKGRPEEDDLSLCRFFT